MEKHGSAKRRAEKNDVTYVVTREFSGEQTMQEVFEDVLERQLQQRWKKKMGRKNS